MILVSAKASRSFSTAMCLATSILVSCRDVPTQINDVVTAPPARLLVSVDPIDPGAPGYASMLTPSPGVSGGFANVPFPASFSEPTLVYARATGLISKTYSSVPNIWPVAVRGTPSFPLDPNGRVWGSSYQCVGNLEFTFNKASGATTTGAFCTRNNTNLIDAVPRSPMDTTFILEGVGNIARVNSIDTGPNCGYASYPSCFDFGGTQYVEMVPWRKTLTLAASPDSILVGDSVTFTASATGNPAIVVRQWRWRDSTGTITSVPCGTAPICQFAPTTSGIMYVTAKVGNNPFVEQASAVAIVITDCDSTEPLFNDPAVRKRLRQLLFASAPDAPNFWDRVEQPLLIYRDASGQITFRTPINISSSPCRVSYDIPTPLPGDSLLAIVHTHPAVPGETFICEDPNAFPPVEVERGRYDGGASPQDLLSFLSPLLPPAPPSTTALPNPLQYVPRIIMDKKNVYAYRKRSSGSSSNPDLTNWSEGYCRWRN